MSSTDVDSGIRPIALQRSSLASATQDADPSAGNPSILGWSDPYFAWLLSRQLAQVGKGNPIPAAIGRENVDEETERWARASQRALSDWSRENPF